MASSPEFPAPSSALTEPAFDVVEPKPPTEDIRKAASESVREGVDIRARIRDMTLLALTSGRFDRYSMREVVRAVTEGMALGAEESRADFRKALAEAFHGMDEALTRSAETGRVALSQFVASGKSLSDTELKQALHTMKRLEDDFLSTAGTVAQAANDKVRPELSRLIDTARVNGTETGKMAAATLTDLAVRFSVASVDITLAGMEVAGVMGSRFAQLASGVLGGIGDALAAAPASQRRNDEPRK
jgi:hypothetical protein